MKKIVVVAIFLFIVVVSGAFGQTTADEWYKKADEYRKIGDYKNAITSYSEAIKQNYSKAAIYRYRGECYFEIKNYNAAIADYNTAIEKAPNVTPFYIFRANTYYQIKNYDAAIADFTTVIDKMPNFSDAYISRGDSYGAKGIYLKAVADYKTGIEKGYDPDKFEVGKPKNIVMSFCMPLYMEIIVNHFLGKSDIVTKYENLLKTICDKNKVTRAEIEAFYRDNIRGLIAVVVDEEFKGKEVRASTKVEIQKVISDFFISPTQSNFNALKTEKEILMLRKEINDYNMAFFISAGMGKRSEAETLLKEVTPLSDRLKSLTGEVIKPGDQNFFREEYEYSSFSHILSLLNYELANNM